MKDIFFTDEFIEFFQLSKIETDAFLYPFLMVDFSGHKSISSLGYQGILIKKNYSDNELKEFYAELKNFRKKNQIVCEFIRYNPFLNNILQLDQRNESSTFFVIETDKNPSSYFENLPSRTRYSIKKAKEKITVKSDKTLGILKGTLKYKNEFFYDEGSLKRLLDAPFSIKFSALFNDEEVASSLFFCSDDTSYYIANFSTEEGKKNNANIFLIYEFYKFCFERKIKYIGLGGGFNDNDSLSFFKSQFSTYTTKIIHSKLVHDQKIYNKLNENLKENYFPPYLSEKNLLKLSNSCSKSD
ncbi:MAG: peptidoglycan bridge formation glycyltransferase FemA/FemB family protein [candidate division WOR-3 bacterium]